MKNDKQFENILNECLDSIVRGSDVASCLKQYPEYANELEPLLETAYAARQAARITPRPEARQRLANEFQAAVREMPRKSRAGFQWKLRWVLPVAIVAVLLIGGGGTVAASTNALPDSPLYGVKLATEQVQLAFTPSRLGKAELYAKFTDRRVNEIIQMAKKGNLAQVERVTQRMDMQLIAMADITGGGQNNLQTAGTAPLMAPAATAPPTTTATPGLAPPVTAAPPLTVTNPPGQGKGSTFGAQDQGQEKGHGQGNGGEQQLTPHQKFKNDLFAKADKHLQDLQALLANAPDSLKDALQHAIEVALQGYQQALDNLANYE